MDRALLRAGRTFGRLYLWAADRLYHEFAPFYDGVSWLVSAGRWARWRSMALDYVRGPVVLEVGFGTGELLREMAARGWRVLGVDSSAEMQRVTSRKLGSSAGPPRLRARAQSLPLLAACCDSVVSTFPAPYIADPATLAECARVLRPGGRLIVAGLLVYTERRTDGLRFHLSPPAEPAVSQFCALVEAAGLDVRLLSRMDGAARLPVVIGERRE